MFLKQVALIGNIILLIHAFLCILALSVNTISAFYIILLVLNIYLIANFVSIPINFHLKAFKILLKLITLITLIGNIGIICWLIFALLSDIIKKRFDAIDSVFFIFLLGLSLFILNAYIIFGIYRKNKLK